MLAVVAATRVALVDVVHVGRVARECPLQCESVDQSQTIARNEPETSRHARRTTRAPALLGCRFRAQHSRGLFRLEYSGARGAADQSAEAERRARGQQLQSPMKNLEVKLSLSGLEFRCRNLFLIWGKHWGART